MPAVWCWTGSVQWVYQSLFVENSCLLLLEIRMMALLRLSHTICCKTKTVTFRKRRRSPCWLLVVRLDMGLFSASGNFRKWALRLWRTSCLLQAHSGTHEKTFTNKHTHRHTHTVESSKGWPSSKLSQMSKQITLLIIFHLLAIAVKEIILVLWSTFPLLRPHTDEYKWACKQTPHSKI